MKRLNQTAQTPSFWDSIQEFRTNKSFRLAESGRSMVEMLGVLAIIGVLSVGAVVGYNHATSKHVANTIMSELNLRAVPLSQMCIQNQMAAGTTLHLEAGDKIASGHTISAKVSINPEYFEMTVNGVQQQSCEMILQDYITSSWIMVNNALYENTTSICSAEENDMTFVYSNNLGERRTCSQKGLFNVTSYKCECAGGTYFDNSKKDCACPAGHIWSDAERKCIESRCQEGEFETLSNGCVPCNDPSIYTINNNDTNAIALCEACPNRMFANSKCLYNQCGQNEFIDVYGKCHSCDEVTAPYIAQASGKLADICTQCPNRVITYNFCAHVDHCPNGFWGRDNGGSLRCYSCDILESSFIGNDKGSFNKCTACGNRSVIQKGKNYYCAKTTCDNDEFVGADGVCYKCTDGIAVLVGENSGCTTVCDRIIDENGYCVIENCPTGTHVRVANGGCFACDTETEFNASEAECSICGDMRGSVGWSNNICRLNSCELGKSFPYLGGSSLCYTCDMAGRNGDGGAATGFSEYAKTYCEACGNYWTPKGNCYMYNSCQRGHEFRAITSNYIFCTSCDYTEKVEIEDHEEHRKICSDCTTTPRFFADNYCYRCDSSESPVVTTSEERASCTKCPNRQISADNQCVLVKTEE